MSPTCCTVPAELEQCYMLLLHKTECYLVSWRSCVCLSVCLGLLVVA